MLLYAITQRSAFPGDLSAQTIALLDQVRKLAVGGVHYLQIREKDLTPPALEALAGSIVAVVSELRSPMKVLLNGPPEIAFRTGCDGIHLTTATALATTHAAHHIYQQVQRTCIVSAACHSLEQVRELHSEASLLLFSPIFEKVAPEQTFPGVGLRALAEAVRLARQTPVIALGGITARNARQCESAGAKGIAAIRLFLTEDWRVIQSGETA